MNTNAVHDSVSKRDGHRQAQLSPTRTRDKKEPAPYGVQRSIASHAPLVRTESNYIMSKARCRCSRPTADTGITVSTTASEANACARRRAARRMLSRSGPMLLSRHRCDCRANRPTAGEAALSHSTYHDAPAVKAHERAAVAMLPGYHNTGENPE